MIYYLNTAIIPIVGILRYQQIDIFSARWYFNVGTVITLSVFFSCAFVFVELILTGDCLASICRKA